jgi:hypothetical protein
MPTRFAMPVFACLLATLAAVLAAAPAASAATLGVPGQYPTLQAAYSAARDGDLIALAPGDHGSQTVPGGSKAVTFRGAPGAKVRTLDNHAANVTFDGIEVDAGFANTAALENHGADNVTFKNARVGNVTNEKGALISGANFTFDNVTFHDVRVTDESVHNECVYAIVVPGMTVRNSSFHECATMDLFFTYGTWWSPLPPAYGNITLENNVFGHTYKDDGTWHYYSLAVGITGSETLDGWVVRNNTFEIPAAVEYESATRSRWVGNLGSWDCVPGFEYRRNAGRKCGPTDKSVSPASSTASTPSAFRFADPANRDFRLTAGSPAIDAADPADSPATDRDGHARDARPDAGAYEFGAGPAPATGRPGGNPETPAAPRRAGLRSARLSRHTICRRARRGCPASVRLRLKVRTPSRVGVRIQRVRGTKAPKARKAFKLHVADARAVRIRARGLALGRYRVVVRTRGTDGAVNARKTLKLRVRR